MVQKASVDLAQLVDELGRGFGGVEEVEREFDPRVAVGEESVGLGRLAIRAKREHFECTREDTDELILAELANLGANGLLGESKLTP